MPLIWNDDLVRFVPPGEPAEWIDLKRELTSGDDDDVFEAMTKVSAGAADDLRVSVRVTALNRERVQRSIVAWSYTHAGAPVEVSDENIARLDRKTYEALIERVDELNPLVLPAKSTTSTAGSKPGTAVTRARRRKA